MGQWDIIVDERVHYIQANYLHLKQFELYNLSPFIALWYFIFINVKIITALAGFKFMAYASKTDKFAKCATHLENEIEE